MKLCPPILLAALLAPLALQACSYETPSAPGSTPAAAEQQPDTPTPEPEPPPGPTAEELAAAEAAAEAERAAQQAAAEAEARADTRRRERVKKLFNEAMEPLTEATEAYDKHDELEESSWFGHDQEDNLEAINELLDQAIGVLGVSEIATTRQDLRRLESEIEALQAQLVEDREARIGAPGREELNRLQNTYTTSREEFDQRIADAQFGIVERQAEMRDLELVFVEEMRAIGIDMDLESARSLLSTVTGDDFVEMCVVFDNVRGVTVQLQELTEQSGESLGAAKRYYGSYVMLIRLMDRIQKDFVRRATEEMIPKLATLAVEAEAIIEQAEENMKRGGDRVIGEQNIASNQLTIQATGLYIEYLRDQAAEIQARNDALQIDLRDAENTYATVSLSSEVAALLQEGQRNFAALLKLDLPSLRGFDNAELKAEFERLTDKVTGVN